MKKICIFDAAAASIAKHRTKNRRTKKIEEFNLRNEGNVMKKVIMSE